LSLPARAERDALQPIVDALGTRVFARECDVSTWTVRAWLSGRRCPAPTSQRRINLLANELCIPSPYPQWNTGMRRKLDS
jgi:hypothetical protein